MIVNCYTTPILKITGLVANVLIHNIQHLRNDDTTRFEFRFRYIKILKNIIVANPSIKCINDRSMNFGLNGVLVSQIRYILLISDNIIFHFVLWFNSVALSTVAM